MAGTHEIVSLILKIKKKNYFNIHVRIKSELFEMNYES
jgi:hypothetical protein